MLNPEILKCHEYLITLETFFICENIKHLWLFGGLGGEGGGGREASIIRLGPSWFTSTLSFILIYMSNIEAI